MNLGFVALAVIAVLVIFVGHKLLAEAFDFVHIALSFAGILLVVLLGWLVFDAISFNSNFWSSESLVLVRDGNTLVGGASINPGSGEAVLLQDEQLANVSGYYASKNYKAAAAGHYKLITVSADSLEKGQVSEASLASLLAEYGKNSGLFLSDFKKGSVTVYPESILFKALRLAPVPSLPDLSLLQRYGNAS